MELYRRQYLSLSSTDNVQHLYIVRQSGKVNLRSAVSIIDQQTCYWQVASEARLRCELAARIDFGDISFSIHCSVAGNI